MVSAYPGGVVYEPARTPYLISRAGFPRSGTLEEQFEFLLRYAILAPSTRNTQPWHFAVSENGVEVYADYTRRLPVSDPASRELIMSLGAALFTLRVAAEAFGFRCVVEYDASGASDRPIATAYLSPEEPRGAGDRPLAGLLPFVVSRRTNRHPFLVSRVPAAVVRALEEASAGHEASVVISTDGALNDRIAVLVADAERRQYADPAFRREVAEWVHPNRARRADGMSGATWGWEHIPSVIAPWATRVLDLGRLRAAHDRNLCIEAPVLVVISAEDDSARWLDSGELLQRLLLTAAREGVQTSYFNMPVQVPVLRVELRQLLHLAAWPQLILRMGYCLTSTEPTPRRPLEEVLLRQRN